MKSTHISFVDEVRSGGFAFCCTDAVNVNILFFLVEKKKTSKCCLRDSQNLKLHLLYLK